MPVQANVPFDQLIVFGASFEDNGTFPDFDLTAAYTPLVPPPGAGLDGSTGARLTNLDPDTGARGSSWVELLSRNFDIGELTPTTPILFPGERTDLPDTDNLNFAVAGAVAEEVLTSVVGESVVVHPLGFLAPEELRADLRAKSPGFIQRLESGQLSISDRTLFVVDAAANDIRVTDPGDAVNVGTGAADTTFEILRALLGAGARTIVVPTFPPMGRFSESTNVAPDGGRTPEAIARRVAVEAYNDALAAGLPGVGGNIIVVDWHTLIGEMIDDPAAFGFSADIDHSRYCYSASEWSLTTIFCTEASGLGKSSGGNPDDFLFNDGLHPTEAMNQVVADYTEAVIRAPGMIAMLPEVALADTRAFQNTVYDYQVRRRWAPQPSGVDFFASVQGEETDYDATRSTPVADSDAVDLTVGISFGLNENWFVGAAIGSQESEVEIDGQGSEFDSSGLLGSAFLGYRSDIWFGDLTLTYGETDLEDIQRIVPLGSTMVRRENGDTEADIIGVAAQGGIDMTGKDSTLRFGPFIGLDYVEIEVDGYDEDGLTSTTMVFGDQERDSLIGSAGLFASYPMNLGSVRTEFFADIAYRKEFEDDVDGAEAVVKTQAAGARFRMPGYKIDDGSVVFSAGVSATLGALRMGLFGSYEDNDRETAYLGLNVAYEF